MGSKLNFRPVVPRPERIENNNLRVFVFLIIIVPMIISSLSLMYYMDVSPRLLINPGPALVSNPPEVQPVDPEFFLHRAKRHSHGGHQRAPRIPGHLIKKLTVGAFGKVKKLLVKAALIGKLKTKTRFRRSLAHPALIGPSRRIPGSLLPFSKTFDRKMLETLRRNGPETPAFLTKNKNIQGNPLAPKA